MGRKATGRESPVKVSRINTELVGKRKHTDGRTRTIAVYARAQTQSVEFSVVERLSRCLSACRYKTANYLRLGALLQSALKKTGQFLGGREEHCRGEDESRPCAYIASPIYLFYVYEPVSRLLSTAAAQRARSVNDSARGLVIRDTV